MLTENIGIGDCVFSQQRHVQYAWLLSITKRFNTTHWGRVTHICVSKLTIIGSENGLSPGRRQAIIWTNDEILLIGPLGTNFNESSIEIHTFSFKKIHLKLSSGKWWPFCLGLNVITQYAVYSMGTRVSHRPHNKFPAILPFPPEASSWISNYIHINYSPRAV